MKKLTPKQKFGLEPTSKGGRVRSPHHPSRGPAKPKPKFAMGGKVKC